MSERTAARSARGGTQQPDQESVVKKLLAFAVCAVALTLSAATTAQDKSPTIKEIMKKGHGAKGLLKGITAQAKEGKWDDAQNDAKLLKEFGESLGSLKPTKGDMDSWKELTGKYKEQTAAVATAAGNKDAKGVTANIGKIQGSCKGCHDAHKGK